MTDAQADAGFRRAVAAIADAPPRRELLLSLDRLPISADAKAFLRDLGEVTVTVGQTVLRIGRKILGFALALAKAFPNTIFGVILGLVVTMLIGSIPLIGWLLAPIVGPLFLVFGLTMGAVSDMRDGALRDRIGELQDALGGLPVRA